MNLALRADGAALAPISPRLELGAYESLWLEQGATFKTLADRFARDPSALPSDFVSRSAAEAAADEVFARLKKSGVHPSMLRYRLIVTRTAGYADVAGWVSASFRSTVGMVRQSLGTTVEHSGLGASTSYYRRT